jgi:predicted amidohydrolase YtcJ
MRFVPAVLALGAAACAPPQSASPTAPPALVLRGGAIHTMNAAQPRADYALAVGGRWACVGTEAHCAPGAPPGAQVIDLRGGSALPGLADAHGHVASFGFFLGDVDLRGVHDEPDAVARIAERARSTPPGTWIFARGWDQTRWPARRFPRHDELSRAVPDHPVLASRIDGHAIWVNAAALRLAGIGRDTPDPAGGRIVRAEDGSPAGVLVDNAEELVRAHVPARSEEAIERAIVDALRQLVALGITSVHDAGVDPRTLAVYRRLAERGALPIHVYAMLDGQQPIGDLRAQMATWRARPAIGRLTVGAVKLYADGALGSRGALLFEPYSDEPTTSGLAVTSADELLVRIVEVARSGLQPCVHAIGDRAVHEVLTDFLRASVAHPSLRPRVEHLQVLDARDVASLVASHAVASMQPTHATSDGPWAEERLGHGTPRQRGAYAWRTVLDAGAPLACGSDFPVEGPDPFAGMRSAVLRTWPGGPAGGWMPEQRMKLEEALRCFTAGAAYAEGAENERGRIAEGYVADAAVLAVDPVVQGVQRLDRSALVATVVEGAVAWRRQLVPPGGGP